MLPTQSPVIDVRQIPPPQRHTAIFGQFDDLLPGEAVQIVSDHDPVRCVTSSTPVRLASFSGPICSLAPTNGAC